MAIRITFKWKMSFSKAVDVQWSAVHEQLTSPGVSASVSVLCELGIREKSVQDGGVEGLYFCSDCCGSDGGLGKEQKVYLGSSSLRKTVTVLGLSVCSSFFQSFISS